MGATVVFGLCVGGTLKFGGPALWQSYFRNASIQSQLRLDSDYLNSERAKLPVLPAMVEGVTFKHWIDMPCADVTLAIDVLQPMADRFHWMPGRDRWQLISRVGAGLVCLLFPFALRRSSLGPAEKLAAAFLCVLSVDFFLPTRISYADVLFLAPIGLLMPSMLQQSKGFIWLAFTILGLVICHGLFFTPLPFSLLRPVLLMTGLLAYLAVRRADRPAAASPAEVLDIPQPYPRAA